MLRWRAESGYIHDTAAGEECEVLEGRRRRMGVTSGIMLIAYIDGKKFLRLYLASHA